MKPLVMTQMMVRAWLDNRKSQTRRVMVDRWGKSPSSLPDTRVAVVLDKALFFARPDEDAPCILELTCPYGRPGETLWIREALFKGRDGHAYYQADEKPVLVEGGHMAWPWKPRILPSRFMPKKACRFFLWNKAVRAERVRDIRFMDCLAEGIISTPFWGQDVDWRAVEADPDREIYRGEDEDGINQRWTDYARGCFWKLWDSINAGRGRAFTDNPWVWVVDLPKRREWQRAVAKGWRTAA
jgi:hypothetical protein